MGIAGGQAALLVVLALAGLLRGIFFAPPPPPGALDDALAAFERAWKGSDYQAKVAAVEQLVATGDPKAIQVVVERALVADDQFVFERTVEILKEKTDAADRAMLAEQAGKHPKKEIRVVLTRMLGSLDTPRAVDAIIAALKDREWTVRAAAVRASRERRAKALVAPLVAAVGSEDGRVKQDAIDALHDLTGADYGKDAKKWASWWAEVEANFTLKPPLSRETIDASEVAKDVETAAREGLYEVRTKRALFIVDLSASMEAKTPKGTRLEVTKKELKRVVGGLGDDTLFNVLFFSDRAQLWKPRMVRASSENRSAAVHLVEAQKASGMTDTYDALKTAFSLDDVDTIFFLSDGFPSSGAVTSEEMLKTEVRKWNRAKGIAIHTIAFVAGDLKGEREDKARAKSFMKELAEENGGTFTLVE